MATTPADPTVILSYARTPMGAMQGALADASATDLGATAVKAAIERSGVDGGDIDRMPVLAQALRDHARGGAFVFDQEDSHTASL